MSTSHITASLASWCQGQTTRATDQGKAVPMPRHSPCKDKVLPWV